jgi:hypothetical protein
MIAQGDNEPKDPAVDRAIIEAHKHFSLHIPGAMDVHTVEAFARTAVEIALAIERTGREVVENDERILVEVLSEEADKRLIQLLPPHVAYVLMLYDLQDDEGALTYTIPEDQVAGALRDGAETVEQDLAAVAAGRILQEQGVHDDKGE